MWETLKTLYLFFFADGSEIELSEERVSVIGSSSLLVNGVKSSDVGEYTCSSKHSDKVITSHNTLTLSVTGKLSENIEGVVFFV